MSSQSQPTPSRFALTVSDGMHVPQTFLRSVAPIVFLVGWATWLACPVGHTKPAAPGVAAGPVVGPKRIKNSIGMKLVLIPAGKFWMGSPRAELDRYDNEGPLHEVEITRPFYLGTYEVTQEEYEEVLGANPSFFCATGPGKDLVKGLDTSRFPVECVSWLYAVGFCKKLSDLPEEKKAGRVYRLPSEAEWEYACRGGANGKDRPPFHFGAALSAKQANFNGNFPYGEAAKGPYLRRTTTVGSYPANAFGLMDMHGNVWEWCSDWFSRDYYSRSPGKDPRGPATGSSRVLRGGSWLYRGKSARSANRLSCPPREFDNYIGFRVVCVPAAGAR
jgi:formylglycine-generating enzyme required for sulfatase activity